MELYNERVRNSGKRRADFIFLFDVLLLFRPGIIRTSTGNTSPNNYDMIKSYLTIGYRSLLKNKGYSFINITGLATGMTVAMMIGLWITDEVTFDHYFDNHKDIAQVMVVQTMEGRSYTGPTVSNPLEDALRTKYKDDFTKLSLVSWEDENATLSVGEKNLTTKQLFAQPEFPEIFSLHMTEGSRDALRDQSRALISKSLAVALFGSESALNKSIRYASSVDFQVGGVYEDFPKNSTFYGLKLIMPWDHPVFSWYNKNTDWSNHSCRLFVQLAHAENVTELADKVKNVPTPFITAWKEELTVQPLDDIHLYNEFTEGRPTGGRIEYVWLIGTIGVFVLLLACINFMNLSTARSEKRAKEVGIRKSVGSSRHQLVGQFLAESIVVTMIALLLTLIITQLTLPLFNLLTKKHISILWDSYQMWIAIIGFALFTGIVSGSYPAFYLSSFKPVKVLKGTFKVGRFASTPRKVLVVMQFTVSIVLIIATAIVYQQIQYAKNRPVGYSREGLITVAAGTPDRQKNYMAIHEALLATGVVENVARSSQSPVYFGNNNGLDWPGRDKSNVVFFRNVSVTPDFGATIGWKIVEGRDFEMNNLADSSGIILNEAALKVTQLKNPIGETVKFWQQDFRIIGIAADMLTQSPYDPPEPSVFVMKGWMGIIDIRIKPAISMHESLPVIEKVFKKYSPDLPFEPKFVDQAYAGKFFEEEKISDLATAFAALAVLISCLGLFGLASFVAEQRTKEIGIRKVMGASVANVWRMLSKDFVLLVMISFIISVPLASYFLTQWLKKYNYHTEISWWIFVATGVGALMLTMMTISYQAIKAGTANPVKSLRSE
jgi:putative ABC transport system permease protein